MKGPSKLFRTISILHQVYRNFPYTFILHKGFMISPSRKTFSVHRLVCADFTMLSELVSTLGWGHLIFLVSESGALHYSQARETKQS